LAIFGLLSSIFPHFAEKKPISVRRRLFLKQNILPPCGGDIFVAIYLSAVPRYDFMKQ
jgi:hypothetical protein